MKILAATSNKNKLIELRAILSRAISGVELVGLDTFAPIREPEETGTRFEENAYIKAKYYFDAFGLPVLADDSGIEVDALDGRPGVHSARFAGPEATDKDNRKKLITDLTALGKEDSGARFRCVLCYLDEYSVVLTEGSCEGRVGLVERGENGFGYDPVFVADGFTETMAELSKDVKNSISHRAKATQAMALRLKSLQLSVSTSDVPMEEIGVEGLVACTVAAAISSENPGVLDRYLAKYITSEGDASRVYEAFLQSYLFGGFPLALESMVTLKFFCGSDYVCSSGEEWRGFETDEFERRGTELASRVYGSVFEDMMPKLASTSPELAAWMITEGYGKTLSRDGLNVVERELCIVALLAVLDKPTQLYSHVRGALLLGVTPQQIDDVEHIVCEMVGVVASDRIRVGMERLQRDR